MAAPQRFRTAFRGFHREDVVSYIEYLNNQHTAQVEQLQNQLYEAKTKVTNNKATDELQAMLDEALQRCAELEEKLAKKLDSITEANWQMLPLHVEFQGARVISAE